MDDFLRGKNSLKNIELELLGDISGKDILHLQCHFGQDTLSLARMGARTCGVDFSPRAIAYARQLNTTLQLDARFICCDVYSLPEHHTSLYDLVFTTYGTIGWLPNINRWARVVSHFLKPGGRLVFAEFHPLIWMLDNDLKEIRYRYFNDEAIVEEESGSYAQPDAAYTTRSMGWNHGLAEVIQALLDQGLELLQFREYDFSPYNVFPDCIEEEPGKFRHKHYKNRIPMTYSLLMQKK
ncbi:MAG TPA: class I SAM-dependent methyltransferase [Chitinophagaceae bacterium]|nr:class I SAM-dependent methyltransferase [Chitinophagaceae bacterium]